MVDDCQDDFRWGIRYSAARPNHIACTNAAAIMSVCCRGCMLRACANDSAMHTTLSVLLQAQHACDFASLT